MTETYGSDGELSGAGMQPETGGSSVKQKAKQQAGQAKQKLGEMSQTVRQEAKNFASTARTRAGERVSGEVEGRKQMVTSTLGDFAEAIRRAGDELGQRDQSMAAGLIRQAADGLESVSRNLADKSPEDMLHAVRDYGRRNPAVFIGGAIVVGLLLGRFVRSTSGEQFGETRSFADEDMDAGSFATGATGSTTGVGAGAALTGGMEGSDPAGADMMDESGFSASAGGSAPAMDPEILAGGSGTDTDTDTAGGDLADSTDLTGAGGGPSTGAGSEHISPGGPMGGSTRTP